MQRISTYLFSALLLVMYSFPGQAQDNGKAKVKIKRSQDGSTEEFYEEFDLEEGQDIEDILHQLDLLDEFGQLKDGQAFEISIRKLDGDQEIQNYDISFFPEGHEFKGFLGVKLKSADEEESASVGALVSEVIGGTAAEESGLEAGDLIVQVDDEPIESLEELVELISAHQAGDEVTVRYVRDGKKKKTKATLGERPLEDQVYRFNGFGDWEDYDGMNYLVFPEDIQEQWERELLEVEIKPFLGVSPACGSSPGDGIELGSITTGSSAEEMGLMVGDRITGFNGKAINSFDELTEAIYEVAPGDEVRIDIVREGKDKKIKGEIGQRAYTSYDDTDIFREFKGCDENGKMEYHYEFDFDEKSLEEMVADLNRREAERQARLDEWAAQQVEAAEELHIFIEVDNISKEDLDQVNASAETPLKNDNDLPVEGISFYPNPNSGVINLNFSLNDRSAVDILIYNHLGSIIYKENVMNFNGSYQNLIDISKEADGIYFLQIMQNGRTYSKKLIKNS